jgi:hypothetical protein
MYIYGKVICLAFDSKVEFMGAIMVRASAICEPHDNPPSLRKPRQIGAAFLPANAVVLGTRSERRSKRLQNSE